MNAIVGSTPLAAVRPHRIADRHVFVFTAALFVVIALAGFVPTSLAKVQAVQAGQRPPFPLELHVHAVLMGAWLLVLLAQSLLIANGRRVAHRVLGSVAALLVPAIAISGVLLIAVTWEGLWSPAAAAMPAAVLAETRTFVTNILLLQVRALLGFTAFVAWALWVRRTDVEAHRRLMLLATAIPLAAGVERLTTALGITTLPDSPLALDLYTIAIVLPLLGWDVLRHAQVHRTTRVWLAFHVTLAVATALLWNSKWWLATAPRWLGVV